MDWDHVNLKRRWPTEHDQEVNHWIASKQPQTKQVNVTNHPKVQVENELTSDQGRRIE